MSKTLSVYAIGSRVISEADVGELPSIASTIEMLRMKGITGIVIGEGNRKIACVLEENDVGDVNVGEPKNG